MKCSLIRRFCPIQYFKYLFYDSPRSNDEVEGTNANRGAFKAGNGKDEPFQETVLAKSVPSKDAAISVPAARSSWGAVSVNVEGAKKDDESQSDADSMAEDDMSVGHSDSDSDDQDMFKSSSKDKQSLNATEVSRSCPSKSGKIYNP